MNEKVDLPGSLFQNVVVFAQRLTNLLASINTFLKQTETHIVRTYGETSKVVRQWNEARQDLHSRKFSYKFLYELRNYSQHVSIPVSVVNIQGDRESEAAPLRVDIKLLVDRDKLLGDYSQWKGAKRELESQPERFDLVPLIEEHLTSMQTLCLRAIEPQVPRLKDCYSYLSAWLRVAKVPREAVPVIFDGESTEPGHPPANFAAVPVQQLFLTHRFIRALVSGLRPDE